MTEKTTKTPPASQNSGIEKDKDLVSDSKGNKKPGDVTSEKLPPKDPAAGVQSKDLPSAGAKSASSASQSKAPAGAQKKDSAGAPAQDKGVTATGGGAGAGGKPPTSASGQPAKKPSSVPILILAVFVVLLALGLTYQYSTSQQDKARLDAESRASSDLARQAQQKAQQAMDALNQQRNMITALQTELREARTELDGLNSAFQTITDRGSDLVLLNDIDHLVVIAQQQLQLNGNVANAIISLETAQAQLARANRPALASLQQTINGDLDRLRAATTVDIALLSARLDELGGLVSQAPLLIPDAVVSRSERPLRESERVLGPDTTRSSADHDSWWEKALAESWTWTSNAFDSLRYELGEFISVRRVDDAAALLISPDQASRFRDSLRQRIMTAQLALMMDQSLIWETETDALLKAIESRFDPASSLTRQAVRIAREVADTAIDTPMPDVSNSIHALEAVRAQMGRHPVTEQSDNRTQSPTGEEGESTVADTQADESQARPAADTDATDGMSNEAGEDTADDVQVEQG